MDRDVKAAERINHVSRIALNHFRPKRVRDVVGNYCVGEMRFRKVDYFASGLDG